MLSMRDVALMGEAGSLVIGFDDPQAIDAECVGPKAANLAALTHAGLPTPGGFCITADAYRLQCSAIGLDEAFRRFAGATPPEERQLS
ncbi:MAG: PEP/pyruvate-binding domain-containing protein, partial [Stellaceae bacterium]